MTELMSIKEERSLCVRKMELWAKEGGTYSAENQAITTRLMAEPTWKLLDEREFINKVHDVFDRAIAGY
jgi:hypothetical protein